ncbi:MAG: RNA polymerase sigma-70 factor [Tannerella sp.]|nr:RNA polymerase sigma-70 factor [Tannerella sp.]
MPEDIKEAEKKFRDNFESVYLSHYQGMVRFAQEYVLYKEDAENIVHDAFAEVWEMRKGYLHKMNYMLAFLFTAIKNKCIDHLRHQIVVREAEDRMQEEFRLSMQMKFDSLEIFDQDELSSEERIDELVTKAIQSLPEKCREIFVKSKIEGMKQVQIAKELNISIHTVEAQMAIAYKKLKQELKDYLPLFLFLLNL